jgi:hypothetical protein
LGRVPAGAPCEMEKVTHHAIKSQIGWSEAV